MPDDLAAAEPVTAAELAAIRARNERPITKPGSLPITHPGVRELMESAADVRRLLAVLADVAKSLLQITDVAGMPDTYWQTDSRVALARGVLGVPDDGRYTHTHLWEATDGP